MNNSAGGYTTIAVYGGKMSGTAYAGSQQHDPSCPTFTILTILPNPLSNLTLRPLDKAYAGSQQQDPSYPTHLTHNPQLLILLDLILPFNHIILT